MPLDGLGAFQAESLLLARAASRWEHCVLRLALVTARLCCHHPLPTALQPIAPEVTEFSQWLFKNAAPTHVCCLLSCFSCCCTAALSATHHRIVPAFLLASEVCLLACGQPELLSDARPSPSSVGAFSEMKNYTSEHRQQQVLVLCSER